MDQDSPQEHAPQALEGLRAHKDARAIVRLMQCQQCSYPLREPMTLPCGNSLCKPCLPSLHKRENITYPMLPGRSEGFLCPFKSCGVEHSMGDCSRDVSLSKMSEVIRSEVSRYRMESSETPLRLDECLHWPTVVDSSMDVMPRTSVLHGGRLVATYIMADMGELNYLSELSYTDMSIDSQGTEALDIAVLEHLKQILHAELECQVCYALMLDPLTTTCGHTFCRKCVVRILDHSNLCPACRRKLLMPPGVITEPSNKYISNLLQGLVPQSIADRAAAAALEEQEDEEYTMPLFPCTLAMPEMPTFLHVFEPRYRLMIRRAVDSGGRKFGMPMYNQTQAPQGQLGQVHYMQYGTVLDISRLEMFPDGRSLIETKGVSRFKILGTTMRDGYLVAKIQRIEDVSLPEEEAIEARETAAQPLDDDSPTARFETMTTQDLLQFGLDFIADARRRSAHWLHERILAAYGQPPTDPAIFPFWFASVLPISELEKYSLLPTTSVRARLKITARWIQRLEAARQ